MVKAGVCKIPIGGSNPPVASVSAAPAEVAEQADATVSKTVGGQPPCGFDSHLRHPISHFTV